MGTCRLEVGCMRLQAGHVRLLGDADRVAGGGIHRVAGGGMVPQGDIAPCARAMYVQDEWISRISRHAREEVAVPRRARAVELATVGRRTRAMPQPLVGIHATRAPRGQGRLGQWVGFRSNGRLHRLLRAKAV